MDKAALRAAGSETVKRILIIFFVLTFVGALGFGQEQDGTLNVTYPEVSISDQLVTDDSTGTVTEQDLRDYETLINQNIVGELGSVLENDSISGFLSMDAVEALAGGFADAGVYGSNVATLRSYPDYRTFYLAAGTNLGTQLPAGSENLFQEGADPALVLADQISAGGGVYLGAAWQTYGIALGVNLDGLAEGLYVSGKFGRVQAQSLPESPGVSFSSSSLGGFVNYRFLDGFWPRGLIRFRGVSVGAGLVRHSSGLSTSIPLTEIAGDDLSTTGTIPKSVLPTEIDTLLSDQTNFPNTYDADYVNATDLGKVGFNPTVNFDVSGNTYTVPVELSTAVRILYFFDFSLGAGIDLSSGGGTTATVSADATPGLEEGSYLESSKYLSIDEGSVNIAWAGTQSPSLVNPRLTFGTAFNLGPVKIDVPMALYFPTGNSGKGYGFSAGVNVGLLW